MTGQVEWLRALLMARVPPEIAAGAAGVCFSTAMKHRSLLRRAGLLGDPEVYKASVRLTRGRLSLGNPTETKAVA